MSVENDQEDNTYEFYMNHLLDYESLIQEAKDEGSPKLNLKAVD